MPNNLNPETISNLAPGSVPDHDFNSPSHEEYFAAPASKGLGVFKIVIIVLVVILLLVAGVWFFLKKTDTKIVSPFGDLNSNSSLGGKNQEPTKTIQNPITGVMYTEEDSSTWSGVRPLAVMINNHPDARPQVGLDKADIVYEIVAEGGITRFLAFFLTHTPEKVGPIRSTREYYLVLVKELGDAMLMHIGWSPQALEAIESWPVRSLGRGGAPFYRDNPRNVAIEHTAYSNGQELRETGLSLGWEGEKVFTSWKFKDDQIGYETESLASEVTIDFWYEGDFTAHFKHDTSTNTYTRYMGYDSAGQPIAHIDDISKQQLSFKNVIVQFASEEAIVGDDKSRLTYDLTGSGNSLIFQDGKVIKSTWSKLDRDARTMYYDLNGKEIEFNRGTFWVSIVPDRNTEQVVYK